MNDEKITQDTIICLTLRATPSLDVDKALETITNGCGHANIDVVQIMGDADGIASLERLLPSKNRWKMGVCLVSSAWSEDQSACWEIMEIVRHWQGLVGGIFIVVLICHRLAAMDPRFRLHAFDAGARMVTNDAEAVCTVARIIADHGTHGGSFACPGGCGVRGLTEDELHEHYPLYHACEPNINPPCPICGECAEITRGGLDVHIHNKHGPLHKREPPSAPYSAFSWVVCRRKDGCFLLVNEPAGLCRSQRPCYWLPAGRVDVGESLIAAACRETLEEGGIEVEIVGVLCFMLGKARRSSKSDASARPPTIRVAFLAQPVSETACMAKTIPDFESCGAIWVSSQQLAEMSIEDFRNDAPVQLYSKVANGALQPFSLDTDEFRNFDRAIVDLTKGGSSLQEFNSAWAALRVAYPSQAFNYSG